MVSEESLTEGQVISDNSQFSYSVIEVLDESVACEVIAKEEVTERGHVIYESKTVADLNPNYPETDTVVKVERDDGKVFLWPISRIEVKS